MEPVPTLVLKRIRDIARDAHRRGVKLDPALILAIAEGRAKA